GATVGPVGPVDQADLISAGRPADHGPAPDRPRGRAVFCPAAGGVAGATPRSGACWSGRAFDRRSPRAGSGRRCLRRRHPPTWQLLTERSLQSAENRRCSVRVLGINAIYHDPAAALVVDGEIVAAAEEERFSRRKHGKRPVPFSAWELPEKSAAWCLAEGGLTAADVDVVTYSFDPALARPAEELGLADPWD